MGRRAGGGKGTVESCRSISVLDWYRHGYLRSPRWFSWGWTENGERVAWINVEAEHDRVYLKYRVRSYGGDWSDVEQGIPVCGRHVGLAENGPGLCVQSREITSIAGGV